MQIRQHPTLIPCCCLRLTCLWWCTLGTSITVGIFWGKFCEKISREKSFVWNEEAEKNENVSDSQENVKKNRENVSSLAEN